MTIEKTTIQIRLYQGELSKYKAIAIKQGFMSISHFMRYACNTAVKRKNKDHKVFENSKRLNVGNTKLNKQTAK